MREHCAICFTADGRAIGVYSDAIPWASLGRILAMPSLAQDGLARPAGCDDPARSYVARYPLLLGHIELHVAGVPSSGSPPHAARS